MRPIVAISLLALVATGDVRRAARAEVARPNDNRDAAGSLRGGVLTLRLEVRAAMWYPDGDRAPGAVVPAFAEDGRAPSIPGPLVRVRAGSIVDAQVRNALAGDTLWVHGLYARTDTTGAAAPPLVLAPGESRRVRFALAAAGTFYYWGATSRRAIDFRTREDAQLTGAIVVDAPGARTDDRVIVMGMWTDTVARSFLRRERVLGVMNGRSFPHTEQLRYEVGDTVRWRVINASADLHPMHLHGFYFRVDALGNGARDTTFAPGMRWLAVTEGMPGGTTLALTWVPERRGNWLFHCHIPEHFGPRGSLGMPPTGHVSHAHGGGMNGLVMGVIVGGREARRAPAVTDASRRRLRLVARENAGGTAERPAFGYALADGSREPPPDSGRGGPPIVLTRGEPVSIMVVNRLKEPTAVHWHGIELESYYDGVPGFSGSGRRVTPLIAPGDSFDVRFTPPRAGTFIYHTHADEERQQFGGLVGALLVLEPGAQRDPSTDIPIVLTQPRLFGDTPEQFEFMTEQRGAPLELVAGRSYRLRLINMAMTRSGARVELWRDSTALQWRELAKDGAPLPPARRATKIASRGLTIGETLDVEVTPDAPGDLRLDILFSRRRIVPRRVLATLPIRVRPAATVGGR